MRLRAPNVRTILSLFHRALIVIYSVFIIKRYKRIRRVTDIFNVSTLVYAALTALKTNISRPALALMLVILLLLLF